MKSLIAVFLISVIVGGFTLTGVTVFVFAQEPAIPAPAEPTQDLQSFSDDFSTDLGSWQYLGSAHRDQTNQHLVLTTSSNDQTGVAFFRAPIQDSFIANFSYKGSGDGFLFFFYKQKYPSTIDWGESYGDNGVAGGSFRVQHSIDYPWIRN